MLLRFKRGQVRIVRARDCWRFNRRQCPRQWLTTRPGHRAGFVACERGV